MSRASGASLTNRLYGVVFLLVIAGLIGLSIASYNKAFTKVVKVTLITDSTGNQLQPQSDVKVRGIRVGEVRSIKSNGRDALLTLALKPSMARLIKNNYQARLLPKTLFGEKYVSLVITDAATPVCNRQMQQTSTPVRTLRKGDVLCQDPSADYAQLEDVLNDILPVLKALRPAELHVTLNALYTALQGRGEQIGRNIEQLNDYLLKLNPQLGQLIDDIDKLGQVAQEYDQLAPDLLGTLANLQTTSRTITQNPAALDTLLQIATDTSNELTGFLTENGDRIITVASQSRQILALLAEYAPEYVCMAQGFADSEKFLEKAFRNGMLNVKIEVVTPRGGYQPGEYPKTVTGVGPQCYGLPNPPKPFVAPDLGDGAPKVGDPSPAALPTAMSANYTQSAIGSAAEVRMINVLIAGQLGTTPDRVPGIATLLAAPLLRGTQVTIA
jgi:virulence factor Mce-like protein